MHSRQQEAGYTLIGVLLIFTIIAILGLSLVSMTIGSVKTSTSERQDQSVYYIAEAGLNSKVKKLEKEVEKEYVEVKNMNNPISFGLSSNVTSIQQELKAEKFNNKIKSLLDNHPDNGELYNYYEGVYGTKKKGEVPDLISPKSKIYVEFKEVSSEDGDNHSFDYLIATVKSIGSIGEDKRLVNKDITIEWTDDGTSGGGELPPFAVFTSGNFEMSNGTITGDIGTTNENKGSISFPSGGPSHDGEIYVPNGNLEVVDNKVQNNISSEIEAIDSNHAIPELPSFPTIPTNYTKIQNKEITNSEGHKTDLISDNSLYVINWISKGIVFEMQEDLEFNTLKITENNTLTINVGSEDKNLVLKHLDLTNGNIKLKGTGNLNLYVKDKITMGSGSTINDYGTSSRINIFYEGSNKFTLAGNQKIYGSLYAKQADLKLTASGGVYGNIFSGGKNIEFGGGADAKAQLVLAPYADVKMNAGGSLRGRIISNKFEMKGGAHVTFIDCEEKDNKNNNYKCGNTVDKGPISPKALEGFGKEPNNGEGSSDDSGEISLDDIFHPQSTKEADIPGKNND